MEWTTTSVIGIVFEIPNLIIHGIGTWLLYCTYRLGPRSPQSLFLMNLALNVFIKNIFLLVLDFLIICYYSSEMTHTEYAFWYINVFFVSGIMYNYVLSMFYITADRLLHITLHMKYRIYFTIRKTKALIATTWVICLSLSVALTLVHHFEYDAMEMVEHQLKMKIYFVYIPSVLLIIYTIFAIITYVMMFLAYARSQIETKGRRGSLYKVYVHSRFSISVLLIGSFLVLMVIPSLIRSGFILSQDNITSFSKEFTLYLKISSRLSDLVDGVIYIFLQPSVRKVFCVKLSCLFRGRFFVSSSQKQKNTSMIFSSGSQNGGSRRLGGVGGVGEGDGACCDEKGYLTASTDL